MAKKFETYWYQESDLVCNAFLYNCRDGDLMPKSGANIAKGEVVVGATGMVAAEEILPGYKAKVVSFKPDRKVEWQGLELRCMGHPNLPSGARTKAELRPFNYAVAELPDTAAVKLATKLGLKVLKAGNGKQVINVELTTFQRQGNGNPRRAKLL